jgi:hypothetical protein
MVKVCRGPFLCKKRLMDGIVHSPFFVVFKPIWSQHSVKPLECQVYSDPTIFHMILCIFFVSHDILDHLLWNILISTVHQYFFSVKKLSCRKFVVYITERLLNIHEKSHFSDGPRQNVAKNVFFKTIRTGTEKNIFQKLLWQFPSIVNQSCGTISLVSICWQKCRSLDNLIGGSEHNLEQLG